MRKNSSFTRTKVDFSQVIRQARYKLNESHKRNSDYLVNNNEKVNLSKFISEKFHSIECKYYCEMYNTNDNRKCFCGEFKKNTEENRFRHIHDKAWNESDCMGMTATESFGKIEFIGEDVTNTKMTEFVRLSSQDNLDDVMNLMFHYWNIEVGTLCISVIGDDKNFKMAKKEKNMFFQGLIKTVKTTNALIITSGLNSGISKLIGDAVQNGQSYLYDKTKHNNFICCLGICSWGNIKKSKNLERAKGKIVQYKVSNEIKSNKPIPLNKNHTHYLFIDDGLQLDFTNAEANNFRSKLETQLYQGSADREAIPLVHLIVEGGHKVFIEACRSIRERVAIIICEGTGRASDILAEGFRMMQTVSDSHIRDGVRIIPENIKNILRRKLIEKNVSEIDKVEEAIQYIEEIIQKDYLITLYDMKENQDLDVTILYSLMKRIEFLSDSKHNTILNQISLCLIWNKVDIAKDKIFIGNVSLSEDEWAIFLNESIKTGKVEFIELFLQNGAVMQDFLTTDVLSQLYEQCPRSMNFKKMVFRLLHRNYFSGLLDVKEILIKIFRNYDDPCFTTINEIIHPFQELFIWSVLMEKHECANYFWIKTEESICLALVATKLYQCLAETSPLDRYRTETLTMWKDYFENLAIKLLEECHDADPETAAYIIEKENKIWGGYTCLEIAYKANDQKFISSVVCQSSIVFTWRGGFNINLFQCFLCIFIPFLIYKRSFDTNYIKQDSQSLSGSVDGDSKIKSLRKLIRFYLAPQTKFCIHTVSFFVFVVYFSYAVLFGMQRMAITNHEIIFIIYIVSMITEKCCEIVQSKADLIVDRIKYWWNINNWNKFDILMLIFTTIGILLRLRLIINPWGNDRVMMYRCTKTIYSLLVGYFYLRFLHLLSVSKTLGPKIVMISKMFKELMLYLIIIAIIIMSYGVTTQAAYFPQRDYSFDTLVNVFDYPYWALYGEITLSSLVYLTYCDSNTNYNISNSCPETNYFLPLITTAYIFIANILLLNILIATFRLIFQKIHKNSIEVWKFTMYSLVIEYDLKPILPLPFSIIANIFDLMSYIYRKYHTTNLDEKISNETTSRDSINHFIKSDEPKPFYFPKSVKVPLESELDKLVKYFENNSQKCVVKNLAMENEQSIESGMKRLESRLKSVTTTIRNIDISVEKTDNPINETSSEIINSHYNKMNDQLRFSDDTFEKKLDETNQNILLLIQKLKKTKPLTKIFETDVMEINKFNNVNLNQADVGFFENQTESLMNKLKVLDSINAKEIEKISQKLDLFQLEMEETIKNIEFALTHITI